MHLPGSPREKIDAHLQLIEVAATGRVEGLDCPACSQRSISVWFTHPAPGNYRTWFVCGNCDLHTRVQHSERPSYFSDTRIRPELEDLDHTILRSAVQELPPQKPR